MRFIATFPFLCAVVALTLSLLCVFAGSKPGYLEDADILTVSVPPFPYNVWTTDNPPSSTSLCSVTPQSTPPHHPLRCSTPLNPPSKVTSTTQSQTSPGPLVSMTSIPRTFSTIAKATTRPPPSQTPPLIPTRMLPSARIIPRFSTLIPRPLSRTS